MCGSLRRRQLSASAAVAAALAARRPRAARAKTGRAKDARLELVDAGREGDDFPCCVQRFLTSLLRLANLEVPESQLYFSGHVIEHVVPGVMYKIQWGTC